MENQSTHSATPQNPAGANKVIPGQKLTVSQYAFEKEGEEFIGVYVGRTTQPWTDAKTGEVKDLAGLVFEKPEEEGRPRYRIWENAGLRAAMAESMVTPGMKVRVVYLGLQDLDGGRTVNKFDIYAA